MSLLYYAIFFLGPLAILVAFSLATQTGFDSISYGFDKIGRASCRERV